MSVQTEINRITTKRNQSFTAVASKGVTVPQGSTLDDLPGLIAQIQPKINRNLLDNWYFVGGGSQLGNGVFPINQRGQTVYNGTGYVIDRWRLPTTHSIELLAGGLRITVCSNAKLNLVIGQTINSVLSNTVYTFSVLVVENNLISPFMFRNGGQSLDNSAPAGAIGVFSTTFTPNYGNMFGFQIDKTISAGKSITIAAVKLELGSEQTLAHNEGTEENPVWVLNEVPDYGEELRKCQRYYQLFRTESLRPTYGEDCRPTMATEQPTKGTLKKGDVTYYTLSSEP